MLALTLCLHCTVLASGAQKLRFVSTNEEDPSHLFVVVGILVEPASFSLFQIESAVELLDVITC